MKITRHNYEEFFILYLDNELSQDERAEVELFVKENPDLQSELDMLFQSQLSADTDLVFTGKEALLKTADSPVNMNNYEQWLLSYIDNELTATEKSCLEQFIAERSTVRAELELLQKTKLQPENIVFGDKSSLYRREEKVKVIAINWRRIAIAASLILAVGTAAVVLFNSKEQKPADIAGIETPNTKPAQQHKVPVAPKAVDEVEQSNDQLASSEPAIKEKEETNLVNTERQPKQAAPVIEKRVIDELKKENIAAVPEVKKTNDLAEPIYNPNVIKPAPQDNPIAMNETRVQEPLTISKETTPVTTVTPDASGALYTSNTSPGPIDEVDESQPGKKNKLRGFFRKVTRTFEKNTNIKATDDEDRLLLGGLAIRL